MNTPVVMFANAAGTIAYSTDGYTHVAWLPTGTQAADVQALYEQLLPILRRYRCSRILSDHRLRPPYAEALRTWVTDDYIPRLEAVTGAGRYAVVQARDVISRLAGRTLTSRLGQSITHRDFGTPEEARDWLLR